MPRSHATAIRNKKLKTYLGIGISRAMSLKYKQSFHMCTPNILLINLDEHKTSIPKTAHIERFKNENATHIHAHPAHSTDDGTRDW